MNDLFRKYAVEAGFPAHVTSYSMRHGFVRDLLGAGVPLHVVKKLVHHTPQSNDAQRHYEGDLTNLDVTALRTNLNPLPAEVLDMLEREYIFSDDQPLQLTKEDEEKIKEELFENDRRAREFKEKYDRLSAQIADLQKSNPKSVSSSRENDIIMVLFLT
jgi:DNA-binding transcriptional MerR regulator